MKLNRNNMLLSILMVVLGAVMFLWPGKSLELVARILGIGLLVMGAISAFTWYRERHKVSANYMTLAIGILMALLGVIVLAAPKGVVSMLPRLVGIAIIINGIVNLAQAMDQRRTGMEKWTVSLIMAILTIALGAFIALHAFGVMKTAVMAIGGILIYNGVSNLWIESRYRKEGRS